MMTHYSRLIAVMRSALAQSSDSDFAAAVSECLIDIWLDDYGSVHPLDDVVVVETSGFSYLFDIEPGRLIAAWGVSQGRFSGSRNSIKSRMAGHPCVGGPGYHRGHAIPHTLGGGTDINLVPQLGSVNIGAFRVLEREAVRTPGAVYFSYWSYSGQTDQIPDNVEQGLLVRGQGGPLNIDIRRHQN
ncbi:hypothetical protein [Cystobacter fuscus]|uniref:hypothetical protein n=1 Tax=Cystobacter fuscus TaxID=43 RepID=UPI0037C15554